MLFVKNVSDQFISERGKYCIILVCSCLDIHRPCMNCGSCFFDTKKIVICFLESTDVEHHNLVKDKNNCLLYLFPILFHHPQIICCHIFFALFAIMLDVQSIFMHFYSYIPKCFVVKFHHPYLRNCGSLA